MFHEFSNTVSANVNCITELIKIVEKRKLNAFVFWRKGLTYSSVLIIFPPVNSSTYIIINLGTKYCFLSISGLIQIC